MPSRDEGLADALEHAADTAEATAHEQQDAADAARDVARELRGPHVDGHPTPDRVRVVLHQLGGSAERLALAVGRLRRAWAARLAAEGLSVRQIGERLGVSHQRVSALLARRARGGS